MALSVRVGINALTAVLKIATYILAFLICVGVVNPSLSYSVTPQQLMTITCVIYLITLFIRECLNNYLTPSFMNLSAFVELAVQLGLERIEIIYFCLTDQGPCPLLLFVPFYYAYDFVFKFFYRFEETDYFTYFFQFFMFQLCVSVYRKENIVFLLVFHVVVFLLRMVTIWTLQFKLAKGSELTSVIIFSTTGLTADSDHLLVKAGEGTYEIFKEGGKTTAQVVPQKKFRDALAIRLWKQFYIPFVSYGVLGLTAHSTEQQEKVYKSMIEKQETYNTSFRSCQEFAFEFATCILIPETAVKMSMTNFKSIVSLVIFYAVPLGIVLAMNVQVVYT